jgi:osmotically-inducible protein OsmY
MVNRETINDRIREQILAHLCWDSCVETSGVDVAVKDGRITLSGKVPSLRIKAQAEKDARAIGGVREIDNQLQVETSMLPGDTEMITAVQSMLEWTADIDASNIVVSGRDGVITLDGSVGAYWEKIKAETIAADLVGVREVRNNLSVVPSSGSDDEEIREEILAALERSYAIDMSDISVMVKNGHATLVGTVPTWDMFVEVDEIAQHTDGVAGVSNELSVE